MSCKFEHMKIHKDFDDNYKLSLFLFYSLKYRYVKKYYYKKFVFFCRLEWQKTLGKIRVQKKTHKHSRTQNRVNILSIDQSQMKKLRYKHVNPIRERRSVSQPHFVETAIVADGSMVEFHQDGDIEIYILTLMNMVCMHY